MDIEKYKKATSLINKIEILRRIIGIDSSEGFENIDLSRHYFVVGDVEIPKELNRDLLDVIIKHRERLQKEFEEL